MTDLHHLTLAELNEGLRARRFSSVELARHFLARIERFNPALNAFITVTGEQALAAAQQADQRSRRARPTPLTGMPLAHKDIFCTDGVLTTCGSRMLTTSSRRTTRPSSSGCRSAGVVMLGKTNMDEFAMGSSNETSWYGPVRNPWDPNKVPGGSSGGSAAAVAARLAPAATGTDTGGSIRQPAALTGITGFKPTYGRVSRYGMIAFASSLDQAGVLTLTAEDAALLLDAMAGFDPRDSTSVDDAGARLLGDARAAAGRLEDRPARRSSSTTGLDADNAQAGARRRSRMLREARREAHRASSLPNLPLSVPTYYVVAPAECSSNLSRFDGVRFGHRCEKPDRTCSTLYKRSRGEGFGAEVKRRIMTGTYVLSAGYYDAYYLQAQKVRRLDHRRLRARVQARSTCSSGPTSPTPAFDIGAKIDDPIDDVPERHLHHRREPRRPAGACRCRAASCGGLPVGLAAHRRRISRKRKLLNVAHRFQRDTDWHTAHAGRVRVSDT